MYNFTHKRSNPIFAFASKVAYYPVRRFFLLSSAFFIFNPLWSQLPDKEFSKLFKKRREIYATIPFHEWPGTEKYLSHGSVDRITADSVYLYLTASDSLFIKEQRKSLILLSPPSLRRNVKTTSDIVEVLEGKAYPSYQAYLEIMEYFRDNYPGKCKIDTLGKSLEGRLLLAARLGNQPYNMDALPVGFFSSSMHGDEVTGYPLMILLINEFLNSSDPDISNILQNMVTIIVPLENPDGTYYISDTTINGATRGNANGVDLNRNYPDPEMGQNPDNNPTQREVSVMMSYLNEIKPSISANFHGGTEVVNYPFDCWSNLHADDNWFRFISSEYAKLAQSGLSGYMTGFDDGITNGYQWYEVHGGRQDYVTYFLRGREVTIELSSEKLLPEEEIPDHWEANFRPMVNYLSQGQYGIHGMVTDSITGEALEAEITIPGHDKLNSSVFSNSSGLFFRYLKEGTYNIFIKAEGYRARLFPGIMVRDFNTTENEFRLLSENYIPPENSFRVAPVPFSHQFDLFADLNTDAEVYTQLYDLNGRLVHESFVFLSAGLNRIPLTPLVEDGFYILKINYLEETRYIRILKQE